jgi:hypothetical protein
VGLFCTPVARNHLQPTNGAPCKAAARPRNSVRRVRNCDGLDNGARGVLRPQARTLTSISARCSRVSNRPVTRTVRPMATLGDRKMEAPVRDP